MALLQAGVFPASSGSLGATQEEEARFWAGQGRAGRTLPRCLGCRGSKPIGFRLSSLAVPQAHGYGTLTGLSQHHNHGGQRKPREVSWAQSKETSPWGQTSPRPGNRLPATRLILFRYRFC